MYYVFEPYCFSIMLGQCSTTLKLLGDDFPLAQLETSSGGESVLSHDTHSGQLVDLVVVSWQTWSTLSTILCFSILVSLS